MVSKRLASFALAVLCYGSNFPPGVLALESSTILHGERLGAFQEPQTQRKDHDDNNQVIDGEKREFCHGNFQTMFMDGFRWSLKPDLSSYSHHSDDRINGNSTSTPPCLAYYVKTWKLNASGKFRGAMVFSFLLALLTEALSRGRFALIEFIHHRHERHRKVLLTIVYALQQWLGTMIMLVSMMYSIEMLLSVVAGLATGNFLFMRESDSNQTAVTGVNNRPASLTSPSPPAAAGNRSASGGRRVVVDLDENRQNLLTTPAAMCCLDGNNSGAGLQMQPRKDD